jgi:hypothetical protein
VELWYEPCVKVRPHTVQYGPVQSGGQSKREKTIFGMRQIGWSGPEIP